MVPEGRAEATDGFMKACRPSLLTCLVLAAVMAAPAALAGNFPATAPSIRPAHAAAPSRRHRPAPRRLDFSPVALRELVRMKFPGSPAGVLPDGWKPAVSSSYAEDFRPTTIDLGLRHQFAGQQSAQIGARITILDCISVDSNRRFALGNRGSKVHGLLGFSYRY